MESPAIFSAPARLLVPRKQVIVSTTKISRNISEPNMDGELDKPNGYMIFEICSKNNGEHIPNKLDQLEKDLGFMLLRNQSQSDAIPGNILDTLEVESIISYVGIILPLSKLTEEVLDNVLHKSITERIDSHRLLYRLYSLGRFFRYYVATSEMSEMASIIGSELACSIASSNYRIKVLESERLERIEMAKIEVEKLRIQMLEKEQEKEERIEMEKLRIQMLEKEKEERIEMEKLRLQFEREKEERKERLEMARLNFEREKENQSKT